MYIRICELVNMYNDCTSIATFRIRKNAQSFEAFKKSPFYKGEDAVYSEWMGDGNVYFFLQGLNYEHRFPVVDIVVISVRPIEIALKEYKAKYPHLYK